ncbi:amidase [Hyphococcus sp.]|uniref:amidase n=1 Tax=Hyphococcus sp. TaxID=2038636 RepID=UPI00208A3FFD|nr:MAG: amidase [Marinicaulis sp.]
MKPTPATLNSGKPNRRDLLRGAALTGAAAGTGALSGCTPGPEPEVESSSLNDGISEATIAEAEKLQGIEFTPSERAQIIEVIDERIQTFATVRAVEMPNDLAPSLVFNPKLPRKSIPSQKNILRLSPITHAMPDNVDDLAFASVVEIGAWLRAGAITSVQLTEIYLKRIAEHDGKLNAYITVTADLAREQAVKADSDLREGRDRGPLHGIPYALKDLADTKGIPTTWGATPFKDRVPEDDAEVTRKLRLAGAVLLGKTACGAIAYGDIWFGAKTRNPWNPKEGSSGSSAGSASAVAAGLCAFAIGTETLGSIVSPSERCGATGLRPTFGRVSRAGFMALCWSLDKVGPICRTVEDTAAVLSAINGYDADDGGAARYGFTYEAMPDVSGMTVGYVPAWFDEGDETDRKALEAMRSLGVTLNEFPWPETDFSSLVEIVLVEAAAAFSDLTLSNKDDELVWQDAEAWPNTWRASRFVSAVDYVQIDRLRRRLMQELGAAFDGFDALIGPHFAGNALLATNATGHPQLAMRAGFAQRAAKTGGDETQQGRETFRAPRGISLWADLYEERKIIALGAALEQALGAAADRPPGF